MTDPDSFRPTVKPNRLSVVFSFFNEAEVLPELIQRCRSVLSRLVAKGDIQDFELVFVNDRSTDDSLKILNSEVHRGDIRILNMARNFGVSPCVMAGFAYCSGGAIVYMDADLQDPPEVIEEMVREWRAGADVVHTVRRSRAGESRIKMAVTKLGYKILKFASQVEVRPNSGDFKLISRRALNQVLRYREKKPFMRAIVTGVGFNQKYIYYDRDSRFSGDTKFPIFSYSVISNFFDSALISFSDFPLKMVSIIGLFVSLLSFGLMGHVIIQKIMGNNIPGWTAIMTAISFFCGIQLIGLGVVGLYINAIFLESKNRPNYIVDNLVGFGPDKIDASVASDRMVMKQSGSSVIFD